MKAEYLPKKEGLYDPEFEHDACGVGFVAHLKGIMPLKIKTTILKI